MAHIGNNWSSRLREIRKLRGLNQESFAKQLSVGFRTYVRYERGEREPSLSLLKDLAEMGVSIRWLLTGDGKMDGPLQEEVARLEALVNYWRANYQLLEANINRARVMIKDRYGEQMAAELCDQLAPKIEVQLRFPHPAGKKTGMVAVAEKSKKKKGEK